MRFLSNISNKIKVLVLVLYSALALVIALLIINGATKQDLFKEYGTKAYDDLMKVCFKFKETRQSSYQTKKDYESSTYEIYVSTEKQQYAKDQKIAISKICFYLSGETTNGKLVFDEGLRNGSISENSSTFSSNYNLATSSSFSKTVKMENDEEKVQNTEPIKLYFKMTYVAKINNVEEKREINYWTDLSKIEKIDFSEFEEREVTNGKIENIGEPFDLKIQKQLATESTTSSANVQKDAIKTTLTLNNPNLNSKTVESSAIEIYGKVQNDVKDKNNYFADYVRLYAFYGNIFSMTGSGSETTLDEAYQLSDLYVVAKVLFTDGTTYTTQYKLDLNKLGTY